MQLRNFQLSQGNDAIFLSGHRVTEANKQSGSVQNGVRTTRVRDGPNNSSSLLDRKSGNQQGNWMRVNIVNIVSVSGWNDP